MRIIKGKFQRRLIHVPAGLPVRPTTDLAKESLFNILNNRIDFDNLRAIDLFAGSGNISYELISRGCAQVIAVDHTLKCIHFISQTAQLLNMENLQTVRSDVFRYLSMQKLPYDLIFADPPYDLPEEDYHALVTLIFEKNLLKEEGNLIIEHSKGVDFSTHARFLESRRYGKVHFSFFTLNNSLESE
ncbi:MAG: 16S rRNA (guanine(966)-N(2))-methyltransferase RsmD [Bacteroidetes bacterium HGW-Bacteroidetes-1]|jgi:16S rRNA (guanine(966)-N(2))-methyltransferase RsmD|nr:MAG: 16S rRNA (guanine(966)-N(2))-methyltransferase RsmD [Bacteroidetes bacterium HGW-Bacteroidetes-1]